jgi:DNA-binding transcriptional regulator YdaS (Cro superfamily)
MNTDMAALLKALELTGGARGLAAALGIKPQAVYQWTHGVRQVPAERCPQIERLTGGAVRCEQLRSDVEWNVLREDA